MQSPNSYTPGRTSNFTDGQHGGDVVGQGTYAATSVQQNVPSMFHPAGVIGMPNAYRTANGMSQSTYGLREPGDSFMVSQINQSASGGGNSAMNT